MLNLPSATDEQLRSFFPHPFGKELQERTAYGSRSLIENPSWVQCFKDGNVLKLTYVNGEGPTVPPLTRVFMNIDARLIFPNSPSDSNTNTASNLNSNQLQVRYLQFLNEWQDEYDFILGKATVARGLELAVSTMQVGEQAFIFMSAANGYSDSRRPKGLPADQPIFMHVRIIGYEQEASIHSMTPKQKLQYIKQRQEIGRKLFTEGKYQSCGRHYERALAVLDSFTTPLPSSNNGMVADKEEDFKLEESTIKDLLATMHANIAACKLKRQEWIAAIEACTKALQVDPQHPKALYRRAEAHRQREEFQESLRDYDNVMGVLQAKQSQSNDNNDSSQDAVLIQQIQKHIQYIRKKEKWILKEEQQRWKANSALSSDKLFTLYDEKPSKGEINTETSANLDAFQFDKDKASPSSWSTCWHRVVQLFRRLCPRVENNKID